MEREYHLPWQPRAYIWGEMEMHKERECHLSLHPSSLMSDICHVLTVGQSTMPSMDPIANMHNLCLYINSHDDKETSPIKVDQS